MCWCVGVFVVRFQVSIWHLLSRRCLADPLAARRPCAVNRTPQTTALPQGVCLGRHQCQARQGAMSSVSVQYRLFGETFPELDLESITNHQKQRPTYMYLGSLHTHIEQPSTPIHNRQNASSTLPPVSHPTLSPKFPSPLTSTPSVTKPSRPRKPLPPAKPSNPSTASSAKRATRA